MKRYDMLFVAIFLNALGTALMKTSELGMTVWGGTALSTSTFFHVSLGTGFLILATLFYTIAVLVRKRFHFFEAVIAFLAIYLFGLLSDLFIQYLPELELAFAYRLILNLLGLLVLNLGISIHLHINLAVFPLDVYTGVMQVAWKSIAKGTTFAYFSAFFVFVILSFFNQSFMGLGIGTIFTLTLSGYHLAFFNKYTSKIKI